MAVQTPPELTTHCEVDTDQMFDLVGVVASFLNVVVVLLVYTYMPV